MFWENTLEWGSNQDLNQTSWNFRSGFPTQDTSVIIVDFRFIPGETNNTMKIQTIYWIYRSIDPRTNQINYHALRLTWENSGSVWHIVTFNQSYMDCSLLRMGRCTLSLSFQLLLLTRVMCSCVEYIILCHTRHINIMCRWYLRSPPCVWEGTRVLFPYPFFGRTHRKLPNPLSPKHRCRASASRIANFVVLSLPDQAQGFTLWVSWVA